MDDWIIVGIILVLTFVWVILMAYIAIKYATKIQDYILEKEHEIEFEKRCANANPESHK